MSNFLEIHQVGAKLFHADSLMDVRTDMTKLVVTFRNFTNTPKHRGCWVS